MSAEPSTPQYIVTAHSSAAMHRKREDAASAARKLEQQHDICNDKEHRGGEAQRSGYILASTMTPFAARKPRKNTPARMSFLSPPSWQDRGTNAMMNTAMRSAKKRKYSIMFTKLPKKLMRLPAELLTPVSAGRVAMKRSPAKGGYRPPAMYAQPCAPLFIKARQQHEHDGKHKRGGGHRLLKRAADEGKDDEREFCRRAVKHIPSQKRRKYGKRNKRFSTIAQR